MTNRTKCHKCDIELFTSEMAATKCTDSECGLGLYMMRGPASRKIIQVETCPIDTIELEGTTKTINAVFALCDDGTLWMQIIGGGKDWMPIDPPPQAGEVESDIYVIVSDTDGGKDPDGPIVHEQYTFSADLANIKERAKKLSDTYGPCRIARLVFIDSKEAPKCESNSSAKSLSKEMEPEL